MGPSTKDGFSPGSKGAGKGPMAWLSYIQALPAHFVHRVRTGGIRFLVQLFLLNFTFIVLFRVLTADEGRRYQAVFPWTGSDSYEAGIDGGLRIVAFGSQDILGSASRVDESHSTWLQKLCIELDCTSLESFVPHHDSERVLAITERYKREVEYLERKSGEVDLLKEPAADFTWLSSQYPVPSQAPDLKQQINNFLSLPAPEEPPRQTLWVFTFGTWEIWNLAAMPLDKGYQSIVDMVDKIFEYIEILNFKSLDPQSVAFSDFWYNATNAEIAELAAANAADKVDPRRLESFRVLIPELFDMSLTPGWKTRPTPLYPHSKPGQMRNAAVLTNKWNKQIKKKLEDWELRGATKPKVTQNEDGSFEVEPMPSPKEDKKPHHKRDGDKKRETIYAPYPRRMGHQSTFAQNIVEAMTEEEMQRAEVDDASGHGAWLLNDTMRFIDVWEPCLSPAEGGAQMSQCATPDDHLFLDDFTISQRAAEVITKDMAKDVVEMMFRRQRAPPAKRWLL